MARSHKIEWEYVRPEEWHPFIRERKRNISVPLEIEDVSLYDKLSKATNIDRAVLLRMAIQFAIKNKTLIEIVEQF